MWIPDRERLVKIVLHTNGEDVETPWAEDLGPHPGRPNARLVRIGNVPFLHAKPTYGDVISVAPGDDGRMSWDSEGRSYEQIVEHLVEDGGRWAMIVDYQVSDESTKLQDAFRQLDLWCEAKDIAVEGCYGEEARGSGRAYLAVPDSLGVQGAWELLLAGNLPIELELIHPVE